MNTALPNGLKRRLLCSVLCASLILPFVLLLPAHALANSDSLETRVRAAFLFNLARYTEWPRSAIPTDQNFHFCVAESEDLKQALQVTLAGKQVSGRAPSIQLVTRTQDIEQCQLLYLPELSPAQTQAWLQAASDRSILLISEGRSFPQTAPGMVGFFLLDGRIRFAINPGHVNQAGLQMSSRLLGLAEIIGGAR